MTKTQTIATLAEKTGLSKSDVSNLLDEVANLAYAEAANGFTLPGIGKVYCRERPERMVRNPATGEQIKKEADKQVKVTIAKALKDSVNG